MSSSSTLWSNTGTGVQMMEQDLDRQSSSLPLPLVMGLNGEMRAVSGNFLNVVQDLVYLAKQTRVGQQEPIMPMQDVEQQTAGDDGDGDELPPPLERVEVRGKPFSVNKILSSMFLVHTYRNIKCHPAN